VSHPLRILSSIAIAAFCAGICGAYAQTAAEPVAESFSQGFGGGPDAEKDDGTGARGPVEEPIQNARDLNGLWKPGVTPRKRPLRSLDDAFLLEDPPLRESAQAIYTTMFPAFVIAVVQTADNIFITFEQPRLVRKIRLNANHPVAPKRTYRGESVGRWEGNTLVVDTIGFNGLGELDISGAPTSPNAHMVERYTKSADGKSIRLLITLEDPDYLSAPLVLERRWVLSNGVQQGEFDCEENPRQDMAGEQTVYLEKLYEPICVRIEGQGAELSRVVCDASR
jgi:hypothetical protein